MLLTAVGLLFASLFFYWADVSFLPSPAAWNQEPWAFVYHEIGIALFAVPIVYAAVKFRLRGAVVATACTAAVVLPHVVAFTTYPTPFSELFSLFVLGTLVSIVLNSRERVQKAHATLEQFVSGTLHVQELEKLYFSRELHDETAQDLVDVLHAIDDIHDGATGQPEIQAMLMRLRASVERVLDGTRRLMEGLRPPELDELGLVRTLQWLCDETQDESGIRVRFSSEGSERELSKEAGLAVYRMAQESLTNVRRHSQAKSVEVALLFDSDHLALTIEDDGQGFQVSTPESLVGRGKFGLVGLSERARLLGGSARLRSAPGEGATVMVELPLDNG
ncbi:MAG: sensor histidine kinase [Dehalococcoidia bacterium]